MPLAPGARVGPYEIVAQIGAGGMGEVYRATDTGLNRDVAIKVLPDEFAQDAERLARFEREARTLASLNHPGIAILHGLERTERTRALVMELIDGPTLADRIAEGPLPIDEATAITRQIADALEAAHEQGVVHRDLKPANIKIRPDGTVKVLDFGLAKTIEAPGTSTGKSMSPTITSPAITQAGMILGTAAYMAPEQARGRGADKRSDVWALGCVIYEMLTGRRAFDGEDVGDTLALILRGEPDWSALPGETPPAMALLLKRMLAKDRRQRVGDVAAVSFVLSEPAMAHPRPAPRRTSRLTIAAAVIAAITLAGVAWWAGRRPGGEAARPVSRFTIPLIGEEQNLSPASNGLALSPDGKYLAYNASGRIYLRPLDRIDASVVPGSESNVTAVGATRRPVFSRDSRWLAFVKDGELRKVAVAGGPPVTVTAASGIAAYAWGADGAILFLSGGTIFRVPEAGGEPEPVQTGLTGRIQSFQLLPDNRFLLTRFRDGTINPSNAEVVVRAFGSDTEDVVLRGGAEAKYLPTGHLVYFSNGSLMAVEFDLDTLATAGVPAPVADRVLSTPAPNLPVAGVHVAISDTGTLAYVTGDSRASAVRELIWVDRLGREESLGFRAGAYVYPRLSPNGQSIGVNLRQDSHGDVWILDVVRKTSRPLTTAPTDERYVVWTADSQRVAFGSNSSDDAATWMQAADGSGAATRLAGFPRSRFPNFIPTSTSAAAAAMIVTATGPSGADLWTVPLNGGPPAPLLHTPSTERNGELSPDAKWLAYESIENGQADIFVVPFPNVAGGRWRVSEAGGSQPAWARDGKELFYLDSQYLLHSVTVDRGAAFVRGAPNRILSRPYVGVLPTFAGRQYDVSSDGKRFLMMKDAGGGSQAEAIAIAVVQNWFEELRRR